MSCYGILSSYIHRRSGHRSTICIKASGAIDSLWFFHAHSGEQGGTDIYLRDGLLRAAVVELQELLSEGSDRSK